MIEEILTWVIIFAVIGAIAGLLFFNGDNEMRSRDKMAIGAAQGAGCVFELVRIAVPIIIIMLIIRACK